MGNQYHEDFYAWTQSQALELRHQRSWFLDWANLAEEIESLGRRDQRAIRHQLTRLLKHLLKWVYQPGHRGVSWRRSIRQVREVIADLIEESPSLRDYPGEQLPVAYRRARLGAIDETGLPASTFPERCPWLVEQVLSEDFWPEA